MATWKKVVVSGSAISQLDNDRNYVSATGLGILSSSAQIAADISGAFTAVSGGFSTRITTNETNIGTNTTNIGTLTSQTSSYALKADISGAFTSTSASIAVDIAALQAAGGATFSSSIASRTTTLEGSGTIQGVGTTNNVTFNSVTTTDDVTVGGDLIVNGTVTTINSTNLNIEDKFILLNSGSAAADGGLVINGAGSAIGWDQSEGRFALDFTGATFDQSAIASDAFIASVVTGDDPNYQKNGNIRINTGNGDIFIYS
jgi:hypothetical protein